MDVVFEFRIDFLQKVFDIDAKRDKVRNGNSLLPRRDTSPWFKDGDVINLATFQ
jgi:hypothetical protein